MNNFFSSLKSRPISFWILLAGAFLSIAWSLYFARVIITTPYQIGFREGTPQVLTSMLLNGENPYAFENQPLSYNAYGISYNLVVLPFAFLFGNTLHIHRWVTFLFILASALFGGYVVFYKSRKYPLAAACSAFFLIAFTGWGGIGSAPTTMGTFLFLTSIFIPYLRGFDKNSVTVSAVLALIAFHTKAYFVLSFGIVITYLFLFVSKRKAIHYGIFFFFLFTIAFASMRLMLPLYFTNIIHGNVSNTYRTFKHLYTQLFWLTIYFSPILLLTIAMLVEKRKKRKSTSPSPQSNYQIEILNLDHPLIAQTYFDYHLYVFIISTLIFIIVLGSHVGNYLAYSYELVVPSFLFWFLLNYDHNKTFGVSSSIVIIVNLFCWQYITLNPEMVSQKNLSAWEKAFSYLNPSLNILNSPTLTSRMVELGMRPTDGGQTDASYLMKPYSDNFLLGPSYKEYDDDEAQYAQSINGSISKQMYDLIIITKDVEVFYNLELIPQYYEMVDQLILYMPATNQKWVVEVWEPK